MTVEDTGVGIPPTSCPSSSRSSARWTARTTRKVGGTGLGLAIVRELSKVLGGNVRRHQRAGPRLHLHRAPGRRAGERALPRRLPGTQAEQELVSVEEVAAKLAPLAAGSTVLVVDDDPLMQQLVAGQLEPAGFKVVAAGRRRHARCGWRAS